MKKVKKVNPLPKILIAACVIASLSSCAFNKPTGPAFVPRTLSNPGKALIYFYRPPGESFGYDRTYFLAINNHKTGNLLHGGYFFREVNPGKVELLSDVNRSARTDFPLIGALAEAAAHPGAAKLTIQVEAGKTYYVRMHPKTSFTHFTPHLDLVSTEVGESEISHCKLIMPKR